MKTKTKKKTRDASALEKSGTQGIVMPVNEVSTDKRNADGGLELSGMPYFEVADSVRKSAEAGDDGEDSVVLSEAQKRLLEVQGVSIDLLLKAYNSMIELAAVRLECKLSNTRVSGVARELKELIKVMAVYDC